MTTFSQLVDEMTLEVVRPDLKAYIASSVNQTIREVHTGKGGIRHKFGTNRVEFELTNVDSYHWNFEIPNFNTFQSPEAVWYSSVQRYAKLRSPGVVNLQRGPIEDLWYYYQSGNFLTFHGCGVAGSQILLSAFYYPRSLVYHKGDVSNPRWASYDVESGIWTYREDTGKTDEELQELSTNWILMRHTDMIREGVRAKVFKRLADSIRMTTSYSAYESMRAEMQSQEIVAEAAFYAA